MSAEAIKYQINKNVSFNPEERLSCYYDFNSGSVFTAQSGAVHQAYLDNAYPAYRTGELFGKIVGATGATANAAKNLATGSGGFITSGAGNFRKNYIEISGSSSWDLTGSCFLLSIKPDLSKDGVLFGSFEKITETINGKEVVSSKGFNLGVNSRGKLFFQSLSKDGEYCFVCNQIELSESNVIGLNFSKGFARIFHFDYLNNKINFDTVNCDISHIKNNTLYLGSSPNYYRNPQQKLYSGEISEFAMFSKRLSRFHLFEIGKGFFGDYYFTSGEAGSKTYLSGYQTSYIYKTGITGYSTSITGYSSVRSGIDGYSQSVITTGVISVQEGSRYNNSYGNYLENQGFLHSSNANSYLPTGDGSSGTLGLQTGNYSVSGYYISGSVVQTNILTPLYGIVALTGATDQLSGVVNTPIYITTYFTGSDMSGITMTGADVYGMQKDYIYSTIQR